MVKATSLRAYRKLRSDMQLQREQRRVLKVFEQRPRELLTRQRIAQLAHMPLASVCGRVFALVEMGLLKVSETWVEIGPKGTSRELICWPWVKA